MRFIFWFNCLFVLCAAPKKSFMCVCFVLLKQPAVSSAHLTFLQKTFRSSIRSYDSRASRCRFKMFWNSCFFLSWYAHSLWLYNTGFTVDGDARVAAVFSSWQGWALWWKQSTFALLTAGKLMKHVWFCSTGWNETENNDMNTEMKPKE